MRLIDADKLNAEFDFIADKYGMGDKKYISIKDIKMIIDNAPTVEQKYYERVIAQINPVIEARAQGEWLMENKLYGGFGDSVLAITCSICKESFVYHGKTHNFCPNCGADMGGTKE